MRLWLYSNQKMIRVLRKRCKKTKGEIVSMCMHAHVFDNFCFTFSFAMKGPPCHAVFIFIMTLSI